jgi:hypothetical protein
MTRYALAAAAGIAVVWLIGVAHATELISLPAFDLDKEGTVPQAYSGLLLLAAAGAAYVSARFGGPARGALLALAGVLAYMSFDEVFRIHEELDSRLDFDWQIIYAPIFAVALAGWVGVERALRDEPAQRAVWIAGAACWGVAQLLEALQWDGVVRPGSIEGEDLSGAALERALSDPSYLLKMLPEELLEMCGSLMFAFVLATLAKRLVAGGEVRLQLRGAQRDAVVHGGLVDRAEERAAAGGPGPDGERRGAVDERL